MAEAAQPTDGAGGPGMGQRDCRVVHVKSREFVVVEVFIPVWCWHSGQVNWPTSQGQLCPPRPWPADDTGHEGVHTASDEDEQEA